MKIEIRRDKHSQPEVVTVLKKLACGVMMVRDEHGKEFAIQDVGDVKNVEGK